MRPQMLRFNPGRDVAMLNALLHTIIEEGLYDRQYVQAHTEDFEELREHIRDYAPEKMAAICGIDAATLREVARTYARAETAIIFWGMGISQHVHGTDNARCLIALALVTGQIGRPGTGLHPLRGQNNVQGASDAGLIPMFYPDYQSVEDPEVRAKFEALWQTPLDDKRGLTVVEIMDAVHRGEIKGMYIMGENPAMSDPDVAARPRGAGQARTSRRAGPVPDRDREIRRCRPAGLGLAGEGRHRHQHQPPGADGPHAPCRCRATRGRIWWIIQEIARRIGLDWAYTASARRVRRDEAGDAVAERHHLGAARARELGDLSRATPRTSPATTSSSATASRPLRAAAGSCRRRSSRRPRSPTPNIRWC